VNNSNYFQHSPQPRFPQSSGYSSPYYSNTPAYSQQQQQQQPQQQPQQQQQQHFSPSLSYASEDTATLNDMYGRWSQGDIAYRRQQQQGKI
jgi:hypothetical protein